MDEAPARAQYLRQFHLYRIAYGPVTILAVGGVASVVRASTSLASQHHQMLLALGIASVAIAAINSLMAKHRVTRMWMYLGYCNAMAGQ